MNVTTVAFLGVRIVIRDSPLTDQPTKKRTMWGVIDMGENVDRSEGSDEKALELRMPPGAPELNPAVCRVLLRILQRAAEAPEPQAAFRAKVRKRAN
jgi:hypothetical protein